MFLRRLTAVLLLALVAQSFAQETAVVHDTDPGPELQPGSVTSNSQHHGELKYSFAPSFNPVGTQVTIQGYGDPELKSAVDDLLNSTKMILDRLLKLETQCIARDQPGELNADLSSTSIPSTSSHTTHSPSVSSSSTDGPYVTNSSTTISPSVSSSTDGPQLTSPPPVPCHLPRDCMEFYSHGMNTSGIYTIYPDGEGGPIEVSCDMETDGGGWTVFQRREDGSVDFFRDWDNYKNGFGNLSSEHWLGNDNIHRLSMQKDYQLRVDLGDFEGETRYAVYNSFSVANEDNNYRLTLGEYSGTAGDSLGHHSSYQFTTKDRDNDAYLPGNCAALWRGGWWYRYCHESNLNGLYNSGVTHRDVVWRSWHGISYSLKTTEMKIRPV